MTVGLGAATQLVREWAVPPCHCELILLLERLLVPQMLAREWAVSLCHCELGAGEAIGITIVGNVAVRVAALVPLRTCAVTVGMGAGNTKPDWAVPLGQSLTSILFCCCSCFFTYFTAHENAARPSMLHPSQYGSTVYIRMALVWSAL